MDFEAELNKLLTLESEPMPKNELSELLAAGQQLLLTLNKKQTDISMQIEEIYDITKELDTNELKESIREEKERTYTAVQTAVGLCDLIDDFCEFAAKSGNEELEQQASIMRKNADNLLGGCEIMRMGARGQQLDPEIHSVQAGTDSDIPRECVSQVLQSGFRYKGDVIRKAVVIVSMGNTHDEVGAEYE